jgi:tetratricopeptide (TPR) repeat protein
MHGLNRLLLAFAATAALVPSPQASAQARISEQIRSLETYPFSDPNPIPILVRDARLYPYHGFDGYAVDPEPRDWKVVVLENDFIEVFVLPEVGGKIWGAIVKDTGHEFIYRNEVMKFRNIALRGPWTSGGIEFNFGVIGHTPSTATPVDYTTRENDDGSVSVFVGAMDLPSRTQWRVEVRLPADKAYFETRVHWYNPTPLAQPYYNWMTAAAFARDDLVMAIPGDQYLKHSGEALTWPIDSLGRDLAPYDNNRFEGNKSYHVVGELNDFFGGYYGDDDYGFGHWSRYEEMPGQKLWLWALSRQGGIWEDLLTDTDGQYVEFQAGRMFVQYQPGEHVNPITKAVFDPMSASRWTETWFPLEGTGGLSDASRDGALHVQRGASRTTVTVSAFTAVSDTLRIWSGDVLLAAEPVALAPLGMFRTSVAVPPGGHIRATLAGLRLDYDSDPSARELSRSFRTDADAMASVPVSDRAAFEAHELMKSRRYAPAAKLFAEALEGEPWHRGARMGAAELAYRSGRYQNALGHIHRVLEIDAYDAEANFLAGTIYRALGSRADARDAFGWATRSTGTRSAAYVQLAAEMLTEGDLEEARRYARLAIEFDRYSVPAWRTLAVLGRKAGDLSLAEAASLELSTLDPLDHFVRAERHISERTPESANALIDALGGEYPEQTLLEMALTYISLGQAEAARTLLALSTDLVQGPVLDAWRAYLAGDADQLGVPSTLAFVFPFRRETLDVLEWAFEQNAHWGWAYLYGLNLWAVHRSDEAADLFVALGDEPDFAPFYVARGRLLNELRGVDGLPDHRRAVALAPDDRLMHVALAQELEARGASDTSLPALADARSRFPDDFNLALFEARALVNEGRPADALEILADVQVLPSEHARGSRQLFSDAHTLIALDAMEAGGFALARGHLTQALEWPESLGEGRPYEPEERLVRFLLGLVEAESGNTASSEAHLRAVVEATDGGEGSTRPLDLLAVAARRALGMEAPPSAGPPPSDPGTLQVDLVRRALALGGAR